MTTNGKHEIVKNKNGISTGTNGHGSVHLSSADVIHLEHEYGAHKSVALPETAGDDLVT